ncbi:MAG: hypothetical protein B7Z37_25350 [Verrucomicrobia bacterium 12-59-8]|nr:MAG: hypothetical protein B7Z37_25350 [Verrucomicrobia bacterium 12-59-8]
MKRRRSNVSRKLWLLFWALIGLLQVWDHQRPKTPPPPPVPDGRFVKLASAHLVEDAGNDGDSFKIADEEGAEYVLRLYFVDCPETRQYVLVNNRLKDQASYFGGLTIPQTLSVGLEAKAFTEKLLREKRFTVQTRWQRVYDSARSYALVFFDDGEELSEKLVKAGLCRIYTRGTVMPDGRREYDFENHLRDLEHQAKAAHRGAWGRPRHVD